MDSNEKSKSKKKGKGCPISEVMALQKEYNLEKGSISRSTAEDLKIPVYSAPKHKQIQGNFYVDFTGLKDPAKEKKKSKDPISDVHNARQEFSKLGTGTIPEAEAKEMGILFKASPLKVEEEFTYQDFTEILNLKK